MHIFFSGIGGVGIGPLAILAKQSGLDVSGSDKQDSGYIDYLKQNGISDIHIGGQYEQINAVHQKNPIDWLVYSSAVAIENPNSDEFRFCKEQHIRMSKRDELINHIISQKNLKLVAIAGTHGKTTTTAMVIWLFKQLDIPVSYVVGAKLSFGEMGAYRPGSKYFVYEADEFDRNFLAFEPHLSLISGVSWDHHEIYPTREEYQQAFKEFIDQSQRTIIWQEDQQYLNLEPTRVIVENSSNNHINAIKLKGLYNRLDAWLAISGAHNLFDAPVEELIGYINRFPGLQRRMEEIIPNLYSDEAHTPEKITGAMSVASEIASEKNQKVVVVFEPLTNRRQHFMLKEYKDCFNGSEKVYWLPSYLAREDPNQRVIPPSELISNLTDPGLAESQEKGPRLKSIIKNHLSHGDLVVCMSGGGGGSLDGWVRDNFK